MVSPGVLTRYQLLSVDTPLFIYVGEQHPVFAAAANPLFSALARGEIRAVASTLIVAELLVAPYRVGSPVQRFLEQLQVHSGLRLVPPSIDICRTAARLRAEHPPLRLPDAIHLATALEERATAFITNDKRLPQLPNLDVLLLSDL